MIITYMKAENLEIQAFPVQETHPVDSGRFNLNVCDFYFYRHWHGRFFQLCHYCNWCMPVACLSVTILCHLANKRAKHGYRTLYSLPVDLKKTFISKIHFNCAYPFDNISVAVVHHCDL